MTRALLVAGLGALLSAGAAFGQGAKPADPNGFAQDVVVPDARAGVAGEIVREGARNDFGNGLSAEVDATRAAEGSKPTPPSK